MIEEGAQVNTAVGDPPLEQGHGPHPDLFDASCAGVDQPVPVGRGRTGEDEHALTSGLVDPVPHGIPDPWNILPFVDKLRRVIFEDQRGVRHG